MLWGVGSLAAAWGLAFSAMPRLQGAWASAVVAWVLVPRLVGSSRTRHGTCVPFLGRWILVHWATGEVLLIHFCLLCFF